MHDVERLSAWTTTTVCQPYTPELLGDFPSISWDFGYI